MTSRRRASARTLTGPGMAFHAVFGGAPELEARVVGHDRRGRPILETPEVTAQAATPREGLRELEAQEMRNDLRSTGRWAADNLIPGLIAASGGRTLGRRVLDGLMREVPSPAVGSYLAHDLATRLLGNEDLRAHGVVASHDLMPGVYNPYDDDPAKQSNGAYIITGDGKRRYAPPSYVDTDGHDTSLTDVLFPF